MKLSSSAYLRAAVSLCSLIVWTTGANAQSVKSASDAPNAAESDTADTADTAEASGDIIVTAQRREEKLQSVPIAISALSSDSLSGRGVVTLSSISQVAPSLNVKSYPASGDTLSLNMRGQGIADSGQITKDGGVGLYIDGFYIARPQGVLFDVGDPERVEVLRGPQGTLYGRNTTGGAINIITKKPSGEFGGRVSATYGSRDYVRGMASIDLPAIGNIAVRGTIAYTDKPGWVKNQGGNNRYHDFGQLAGRVAVRWTPSADVTIDYAFARGRVTTTPAYFVNPAFVGSLPGYVATRDQTWTALPLPESESNFVDHQLTAQFDVSDSLTLRSLSAYRGSTSHQFVNYSVALTAPTFPVGLTGREDYRSKQYSQEFQLIGEIGDRFSYTGGLFYARETGRHDKMQDQFLIPFNRHVISDRTVEAKSTSYAAYLQATITPPVLDDRLKLTLGARYTSDKRSATRNSLVNGNPIEVNARNNQSFDNFSPAATLAMQWTPSILTYVKVSKGYKAGGSSEAAPVFANTFNPEKITSYEAGLKSQFLDNAVTFNVTAFHNVFNDLQIDFVTDPANPAVVSTINAGKAQVNGFEVDLTIQPSSNLSVRAAYSYLDPKVKQVLAPAGTIFDRLRNPASPFSVGDDVTPYFTLPFAPTNALSVSGDWTFLHFGENELSFHANYSYEDAVYTIATAGPAVLGRDLHASEPLERVDLRLTWATQLINDRRARLSFFANNVFDKRATQFTIAGGSPLTGYVRQAAPYSEPRVLGIEANIEF